MATTTRVLTASVNGTVYTTNANGALEAIDTCHSGATAPTNEVANGKFWLDTTTTPGILKIYNNATWEAVLTATGTSQAKLDGIEAGADVTDTTNVTAAGALMDSELTNLAQVKAFDTTDYATAAQGATADAAAPLASPTFTGVPAAPTAAEGTDTTQIATTAFVLANSGGGGAPIVIDITTTSTWTKPATITDTARVLIERWGGGAGGSSDSTGFDAGGGGGGGYLSDWVVGADMGATEAATVGAGGAGGTGNNGNGNDGGDTTFMGFTATGGLKGLTNDNTPAVGGGPEGVLTSGHWSGGTGGTPSVRSNTGASEAVFGGGGGAEGDTTTQGEWAGGVSVFGGNGGSTGNDGVFPAGGGGGGDNSFGGGDGANGLIRLTVYP